MSRDDMTFMDHDSADPIRSCRRKKEYPSEAVARLAIDSIRRGSPDAAVRPYACRQCGGWHVGATPVDSRFVVPEVDVELVRRRMGLDKPARRSRFGDPRRRRPDKRRRLDEED